MQFSLSWVFGVILIVAIGFAAIYVDPLYYGGWWARFMFSFGVAPLLFTALVGTFCRRRERRAFWLGASIFGWGYLMFAFFHGTRDYLVTDYLFQALAEIVERPFRGIVGNEPIVNRMGRRMDVPLWNWSRQPATVIVGHLYVTILVAVGGGHVGKALYGSQDLPHRDNLADGDG